MTVLRELHKEEEEIRDDFARWLIESLLEDE